jgi:hypothetical protein
MTCPAVPVSFHSGGGLHKYPPEMILSGLCQHISFKLGLFDSELVQNLTIHCHITILLQLLI